MQPRIAFVHGLFALGLVTPLCAQGTADRDLALKYATFATNAAPPPAPADLLAAPAVADARGYFLVQFAPPVTDQKKAALVALGVELLDFVPAHAFFARGTGAARAAATTHASVVWVGDLHPAYRIDPLLLAAPLAGNEPVRLLVHAFAGIDARTATSQVEAAGGRVLRADTTLGRAVLLVEAPARAVRGLARARDLQWVEPDAELTERNDTVTWTVQTFTPNNRKIWDKGLHGEGQVIGHMDGSVLATSCYFDDPGVPVGPTHRKVVYRSGTGSTSSHGTHTAGTAAGDPFPVSGTTAGRGVAYAARLAHSSNYSSSAWASLATTHRANGARFHTNSWGNDNTTAYDSICNAIDAFSWQNEDNLVFFAETNGSTLKNPENAKNLVAVGNANNGTGANSKCGGGVGPTADGRRKPDLFAPGCSIQSASSSVACGTRSLTGTSMACPGATGAAALVRQYFVDGFYPSGAAVPADGFEPSGALVKAVLINTCQDMTGVAGYPNFTEGWGRINLDESLFFVGDGARLWAADVRRASGLASGAVRTYTIDVVSGAEPLEVTLAFTDFAGTVNASNPVVNDLDLVVRAPNGATFLGNVFVNNWSSVGGLADPKNNVERVAIQSPAAGTWTITVGATAVPQGPQGFAVCATGDLAGCFHLAANQRYGAGKPGQRGLPVLASSTLPELPSVWRLELTNTLANATVVAIYGFAPAAVPFDDGTLLVTPGELLGLTSNASGALDLVVPLPDASILCGLSVYWQMWIPLDPGASGQGWAASNGLRMILGH